MAAAAAAAAAEVVAIHVAASEALQSGTAAADIAMLERLYYALAAEAKLGAYLRSVQEWVVPVVPPTLPAAPECPSCSGSGGSTSVTPKRIRRLGQISLGGSSSSSIGSGGGSNGGNGGGDGEDGDDGGAGSMDVPPASHRSGSSSSASARSRDGAGDTVMASSPLPSPAASSIPSSPLSATAATATAGTATSATSATGEGVASGRAVRLQRSRLGGAALSSTQTQHLQSCVVPRSAAMLTAVPPPMQRWALARCNLPGRESVALWYLPYVDDDADLRAELTKAEYDLCIRVDRRAMAARAARVAARGFAFSLRLATHGASPATLATLANYVDPALGNAAAVTAASPSQDSLSPPPPSTVPAAPRTGSGKDASLVRKRSAGDRVKGGGSGGGSGSGDEGEGGAVVGVAAVVQVADAVTADALQALLRVPAPGSGRVEWRAPVPPVPLDDFVTTRGDSGWGGAVGDLLARGTFALVMPPASGAPLLPALTHGGPPSDDSGGEGGAALYASGALRPRHSRALPVDDDSSGGGGSGGGGGGGGGGIRAGRVVPGNAFGPPATPICTDLLPHRSLFCRLCLCYACALHPATVLADPASLQRRWEVNQLPDALQASVSSGGGRASLLFAVAAAGASRPAKRAAPGGAGARGQKRRPRAAGSAAVGGDGDGGGAGGEGEGDGGGDGDGDGGGGGGGGGGGDGEAGDEGAGGGEGDGGGDGGDDGGSDGTASDGDGAPPRRPPSIMPKAGEAGSEVVGARISLLASVVRSAILPGHVLPTSPSGALAAAGSPCGPACFRVARGAPAAGITPVPPAAVPASPAWLLELYLRCAGDACSMAALLGVPCTAVAAACAAAGSDDSSHGGAGGDRARRPSWGALLASVAARPLVRPPRQVESLGRQARLQTRLVAERTAAWAAGKSAPLESCHHEGPCYRNPHCACFQNSNACTKFCGCDRACPARWAGCTCRSGCRRSSCPCHVANRECDPDLCTTCRCGDVIVLSNCAGADRPPRRLPHSACVAHVTPPPYARGAAPPPAPADVLAPSTPLGTRVAALAATTDAHAAAALRRAILSQLPFCANVQLQGRMHRRTRVGLSSTPNAGCGLFLDDTADVNDLIGEYVGELVSSGEADRRGVLYDMMNVSYLFDLDARTTVDATSTGNKMRFANHADAPNCAPVVTVAHGEYRIGLFATRRLGPHDELFFSYGYRNKVPWQVNSALARKPTMDAAVRALHREASAAAAASAAPPSARPHAAARTAAASARGKGGGGGKQTAARASARSVGAIAADGGAGGSGSGGGSSGGDALVLPLPPPPPPPPCGGAGDMTAAGLEGEAEACELLLPAHALCALAASTPHTGTGAPLQPPPPAPYFR